MTIKLSGAEVESGAYRAGRNAHAEGWNTQATGVGAHAEGLGSSASGSYSHAGGQYSVADANYMWARSGSGSNLLPATARAQTSINHINFSTTTTSATTLTFDNAAPSVVVSSTNVLLVPNFSSYLFELHLVARRVGATATYNAWLISGMLARDSGVATLSLVGQTTLASYAGTTAAGTVALSANTTSGYLQITATPSAANQTLWCGTLLATELAATS